MDFEDLRRLAMALPEVEEFVHFKFHTPGFAVNGHPFAGLEKDGRSVVFSVGQRDAAALVEAASDRYVEVWRPGRVRSLVGIRTILAGLSEDQLHELIERAWCNKAPKKLVAAHAASQASD